CYSPAWIFVRSSPIDSATRISRKHSALRGPATAVRSFSIGKNSDKSRSPDLVRRNPCVSQISLRDICFKSGLVLDSLSSGFPTKTRRRDAPGDESIRPCSFVGQAAPALRL